ncbi:MFS transporter [Candidatus Poriferisodalis sp.]|uniref:MFS transporter n=1 Tax=Candidatus Poriferisodalis sp. TaxID=3101277 RepID=UPI003B02EBF3
MPAQYASPVLFVTVYSTQFFVTASMGVVFAYLADLQDRYELSNIELGLIASVGFVAALAAQLLLSPLVDRGHARSIAWISVVTAVGGAFGFVFAHSAWSLVGSRALAGVSFGLFGLVARKALIGQDISGSGTKVGGLLSCGVAGFITGPFIGAAMSGIAFEAPFVFTGTVVAVLGPIAVVQISRSPIAASPVDYSHLAALLRRPRVQAAICVHVGVWGFVGMFDATVDRYLTDVGLTSGEFAAGLLMIGIPLILLPPHAGSLAERLGGARVAIPALMVFTPAVVLYGWVGGLWSFVLIGLAESTTESYSEMGSQVLILEATGVEQAAMGTGALEAIGLAMAAIAAQAGPPLYAEYGSRWLFGGWGVACGVLVIVAMWRLRAVKTPPKGMKLAH